MNRRKLLYLIPFLSAAPVLASVDSRSVGEKVFEFEQSCAEDISANKKLIDHLYSLKSEGSYQNPLPFRYTRRSADRLVEYLRAHGEKKEDCYANFYINGAGDRFECKFGKNHPKISFILGLTITKEDFEKFDL